MHALPYRQGVGIMLANAAGHIFVGQRIDSRADAWQMPQGGIDPGEVAEDALWRELWEETGVTREKAALVARGKSPHRYDLPVDLQASIWGGAYRGQEQIWFLLRFLGEDADVDINACHAEFNAWQWVEPAALPNLIVPFKRQLYADLVAEFAPLI
ncbi:MAG: RNA pyrophosphohydrolase [Sphingomonadaceae bacterium]|nr:RNA pyrophosphohydrolase [Sphingomonadaceae bacterium]